MTISPLHYSVPPHHGPAEAQQPCYGTAAGVTYWGGCLQASPWVAVSQQPPQQHWDASMCLPPLLELLTQRAKGQVQGQGCVHDPEREA